MSLKPSPVPDVPELTARVARAAFPKGNPYLRLRDELGHRLPRRRLRRPLPQARTARTAPLEARPGHRHAVRRGPLRSPGRRRRPRPHRLEVRPRARARRPRIPLLRPLRVPRPPHRRRGRTAPPGRDARGLQGPRPAQGPRPPAHRLDPRPGRHPRPQPPGAGRRDAPGHPQRPGDGRAGVAAPAGPARVVRPPRGAGRGDAPAQGPGGPLRARRGHRRRRVSPPGGPPARRGGGLAVAGPRRRGPAPGLADPVLPRRRPGPLADRGRSGAGGPADQHAVRRGGDLRQQAEHDVDRVQGPCDRDL